jgi:ubiquinone/menaquinone biosynthesis C-methylase UbiE
MKDLKDSKPPDDLDWRHWVDCWDRMQARYLVKRAERFETIIRLIRETQYPVTAILDLGCGTGSLMLSILEAFPESEIVGIDFDPTLLWLAEARLTDFATRSRVILADLRDISWMKSVKSPFDAVVSATALHWFNATQLAELYKQIAQIMRPGGIFLNADHIGSDSPEIQQAWERHRDKMRAQEAISDGDDWDGFWREYSQALGLGIREIHQHVIGGWEGGIEEGFPLAWHLDRLRECGFSSVDCFWRCDCDAIYGGIRK